MDARFAVSFSCDLTLSSICFASKVRLSLNEALKVSEETKCSTALFTHSSTFILRISSASAGSLSVIQSFNLDSRFDHIRSVNLSMEAVSSFVALLLLRVVLEAILRSCFLFLSHLSRYKYYEMARRLKSASILLGVSRDPPEQ